jgi:Rad52/22 family double-strand break repair protein
MNREVLCRPFPPELVRHRPGRNGTTISYVSTAHVIQRLNEAVDAWSFQILEHSIEQDEVIVIGRLEADGVIKCSFGGSRVTLDQAGQIVSLADDLKSAASDALKKSASMLGLGLHLYGGGPAPAPTNGGNGHGTRTNGGNGAPSPGDRITSRQVSAIWANCRKHGVTREALGNLLVQRFKKDKVELLSKRQASSLLDHFAAAPAQQ